MSLRHAMLGSDAHVRQATLTRRLIIDLNAIAQLKAGPNRLKAGLCDVKDTLYPCN